MKRPAAALAGLALGLGLAACSRTPEPESKPAPDFEAKALDGKTLRLSGLRGKVVLLDFWATWCGPCEETIPHLLELYRLHGARGLEIVGISVDDTDSDVPPFVAQHGMRYPVVVDSDKDLLELYGVRSIPTSVLVDREGRIRGRWLGSGDEVERELEAAVLKLLAEPEKSS